LKVVAITGPGEAQVVDRPDPVARDEFVVVRVDVTPMCTEYKAFRAGQRTDVLGHEAAGTVVEVARPGRVRVGDRVVAMPQSGCGRCPLCLRGDYIHCQAPPDPLAATGSAAGTATYGQYLLKQDWLLVPVPADLPLHHAAMACCGLGPTFAAMERMRVTAADTVLITGMGPVGLGGVVHAVARGARVLAVEGQPVRARLARALGATAVIDPADPHAREAILDLSGGGPDQGLDCSGAAQAQRLLIDSVRRRGQVAFVGEAGELGLHVSRDLLRKGLTLHGVWHYNLGDAPRLMALIARLSDQLSRFITHTFPLAQVAAAWQLQARGDCGKVILDPWA
jgi:L-iditol 2-dehydrogenase